MPPLPALDCLEKNLRRLNLFVDEVVVARDARRAFLERHGVHPLPPFALGLDPLHDVARAAGLAVVLQHLHADSLRSSGPQLFERTRCGKIVREPHEQLTRANEVLPHRESQTS